MDNTIDPDQISSVDMKQFYTIYEIADSFRGMNFSKQAKIRKELEIELKVYDGRKCYQREDMIKLLLHEGWGVLPFMGEAHWFNFRYMVKDF